MTQVRYRWRYKRLIRILAERKAWMYVLYGAQGKPWTYEYDWETEEMQRVEITPKYVKGVMKQLQKEYKILSIYDLLYETEKTYI